MRLTTIVVPAYNAQATLRESLQSILAQTYPRTEILVMDDASTDATATILAEFGERVQVIRQPRNLGQFGNVNDGIERASGDYIAVYHADDVYDPHIIEREVAFLETHSEVGAVFSTDIFIDARGRELGRLVLPADVPAGRSLDYAAVLNGLLTYKNRFLRGPSALVRRSVYQAVGPYDDTYGIASDLEMWVRIARAYRLAVIDEHLFSYRRGHGSSSDHYARLRTETEGYFTILDRELDRGGRQFAQPAALRAFEAHRMEERLMRVIAHYILRQRTAARRLMNEVEPLPILVSPRVQRARLLNLYALLQILVRLPSITFAVDAFARRWHPGFSREGVRST